MDKDGSDTSDTKIAISEEAAIAIVKRYEEAKEIVRKKQLAREAEEKKKQEERDREEWKKKSCIEKTFTIILEIIAFAGIIFGCILYLFLVVLDSQYRYRRW